MKIITSLILIAMFSSLFSCSSSNKILATKPEPSANAPMVYQTNTSMVSMPINVSLSEIENQLNKSLVDMIYEDDNLEDDKTQMKIWKTAPIKITNKNGKIESVLPLKIWAKIKYGTEFMGLNDTKEINVNGTITLLSDIKFSNWKMVTKSEIEDFNWSESPTILVAGKNVPITYIINPTMSIFKSKVAKKIDEAIEKTCDFKPYVLNVLETMSKPFQTSEQYESWFKLNPMEVSVTDATLEKNVVTMNLGLKCTMQTMIGQEPKSAFNKDAITFKPVSKIPENTSATIAAVSTYESASRIVTKNFKGQEFASGSRKIVVQKVDLWAKDEKMIIALDMTGSLNGTIYLSGVPNYDTATKEIYFDKMDYVLNTKGVLTKTANWLLSGVILKKIQQSCRYSIQSNLDEGKKSLLPYLNNFSPMAGVFVNGTLDDFDFQKVELTNTAIIAFIKASGKMSVKIDGMN